MNLWLVAPAIVGLAVVYALLSVALTTLSRYRQLRLLQCPETGEDCWVRFDAARAALSSCLGRRRLAVQSCSLWPGKAHCSRACARLPEAAMWDVHDAMTYLRQERHPLKTGATQDAGRL
jgi:hypothetical protein